MSRPLLEDLLELLDWIADCDAELWGKQLDARALAKHLRAGERSILDELREAPCECTWSSLTVDTVEARDGHQIVPDGEGWVREYRLPRCWPCRARAADEVPK